MSALILKRGWLDFRAHSLVVSRGLICLVAPFDVLFLYWCFILVSFILLLSCCTMMRIKITITLYVHQTIFFIFMMLLYLQATRDSISRSLSNKCCSLSRLVRLFGTTQLPYKLSNWRRLRILRNSASACCDRIFFIIRLSIMLNSSFRTHSDYRLLCLLLL